MTIGTEEFVESFHSITGITIGERRKQLFLLLNTVGDPQIINFAALQAKTPLEETFKVEALIYFKKIPELIQVLESENPILIKKILKVSSWFLEQLLDHVGVDEFINTVFPLLSFNAKVKLINKLALYLKDTQRADAVFNAIQLKYGSYLAVKLLPCCSAEVILRYAKSSRIELTARQLLIIVKKYPELIESILEALSQYQQQNEVGAKYKIIFRHVLQNDAQYFLKLSKKYSPGVRLGWRATNTSVLANKKNIIEHAPQFYEFLHRKQVVKSLAQDFQEFYFHMFPTLSKLKCRFNFYLDLLPPSTNKLHLVLTTFQKCYGSEIWDHPTLITPGLLELMSRDEREIWMQAHSRPKAMSKEAWICLMRTDKSLPQLKKQISLTSDIGERAGLVGCLVETCRINDDRVALIDVCKYVCSQLRRDDSSVLQCFLKTLKNCFSPDKFDDELWKYVNDIVKVFVSRNELQHYYLEWLYAYIKYRLANNLSIKEQMKELAAKSNLSNVYGTDTKNLDCGKEFLLAYWDIIPEVYKTDIESHHLSFLNTVIRFNKKYPKAQIPVLHYMEAFNSLIAVFKKESNYYIADVIAGYLIRLEFGDAEKAQFLDVYFKRKKFSVDMVSLEWLFKYKPAATLGYIDEIANAVLDLWYTLIHSSFWKTCRKYSHLKIPQKIIGICLGIIINEEETESRKKNAITALSYLMEPAEFLNFIAPYYPSDLVMDVNDQDNQETYKIQQAITASLKNLIPPSSALESVLEFSKGDYLKFIQRSLHSVAHSVPEEKLVPFFAALTNRAVSVRKHEIYLTLKVLDRAHIYEMLTKFMATEKNVSIRKFLFNGTFRYFTKNPDEYLWGLVKQNMQAVDINDKEALDALLEIERVPPRYLAQYLIFTWNFLEAIPNPNNDVQSGKSRLLDAISASVIANLPSDFCLGIIQKYLFKLEDEADFRTKIDSFACRYIVYGEPELDQERVGFVFEIMKGYIGATWYKPDTKITGRKFTDEFLKQFCSHFIKKDCPSKRTLIIFAELWNAILKPHQALNEFLHLQFTLIYVDYVNNNLSLPHIAERLAKLIDSLPNFWIDGTGPVNLVSNCLKLFIGNFLTGTDEELEESRLVFIEGLINISNSTKYLMMAISLLPLEVSTIASGKLTYNKIVQTLLMNADPLVQLSLSDYFNRIADLNEFVVPVENKRATKNRRTRGWMRYFVDYSSKYEK